MIYADISLKLRKVDGQIQNLTSQMAVDSNRLEHVCRLIYVEDDLC